MTAPMMDPNAMQGAPQPPVLAPLPNPFPIRPNDDQPDVATVYMKRLSKLFVDPKYESFPPEWQQLAIDAYMRARMALQAQAMAAQQPQPGEPSQPGQPKQPQKPGAAKVKSGMNSMPQGTPL